MTCLLNQIRRGFYMDSVALMRISRSISALSGVQNAALMIGSITNKALLRESGLLDGEAEAAGANDLIVAVLGSNQETAAAALQQAASLLDSPGSTYKETAQNPKSIGEAIRLQPESNLALISIPGEFAASEARAALSNGLHVMMFSDNVPVAEEIALKNEAKRRGLLMMGPDCGSAIIAGMPVAFANVVPRGEIGIVAASGTGLQEISTLIGRNGKGISHAIGVGGRDLTEQVGGITTLMAIDALDRDPSTTAVVLVSKPPARSVANGILERVGRSEKRFSICFIGIDNLDVPSNVVLTSDLRSAAEAVLPGQSIEWRSPHPSTSELASQVVSGRRRMIGLFSGGTLCAEAQLFLRRADIDFVSNVPLPGVKKWNDQDVDVNLIIDLGDDSYTVGRPHPMIDPALRNKMLLEALDRDTAVILFDLVIGYGSHVDPAGELGKLLNGVRHRRAILVSSVCGTELDPQSYSRQVKALSECGVIVAPSNAHASELAAEILNCLA